MLVVKMDGWKLLIVIFLELRRLGGALVAVNEKRLQYPA